jgi:hypothetical protein
MKLLAPGGAVGGCVVGQPTTQSMAASSGWASSCRTCTSRVAVLSFANGNVAAVVSRSSVRRGCCRSAVRAALDRVSGAGSRHSRGRGCHPVVQRDHFRPWLDHRGGRLDRGSRGPRTRRASECRDRRAGTSRRNGRGRYHRDNAGANQPLGTTPGTAVLIGLLAGSLRRRSARIPCPSGHSYSSRPTPEPTEEQGRSGLPRRLPMRTPPLRA